MFFFFLNLEKICDKLVKKILKVVIKKIKMQFNLIFYITSLNSNFILFFIQFQE